MGAMDAAVALRSVFSEGMQALAPSRSNHTASSLIAATHAQSPAVSRAVVRLLRGQPVRLFVVGGSAAAGAAGIGINGTFDALLVDSLNALLERAARRTRVPLGRFERHSVANGGTSSLWAGLFGSALHGRRPHLLLWDYAINDHAVGSEWLDG